VAKVETTQLTFRLPVYVLDQLDELCKLTDSKRSEILINLIIAEYDRIQGNPKMKEIMQQMVDLEQALKGIQGIAKKNTVLGDNE
jgi:hypothetical protein